MRGSHIPGFPVDGHIFYGKLVPSGQSRYEIQREISHCRTQSLLLMTLIRVPASRLLDSLNHCKFAHLLSFLGIEEESATTKFDPVFPSLLS